MRLIVWHSAVTLPTRPPLKLMCDRSLHHERVRELIVPEASLLGYFLPSRIAVKRPDGSCEPAAAVLGLPNRYAYSLTDETLANDLDTLGKIACVEWEEVMVSGLTIFRAKCICFEDV